MSPTLLSRRHLKAAGRDFTPLVQALGAWLNLSPLAAIRSQRADAEAA
jgi:hypothetical protein